MLTKQLTLREDFHKETKVETAGLLKKFEDASEKLTSKSEELKALVDEKQKVIDCLQQQFEEASEKLTLKSEEHKTLVGEKQKEIDCLRQALEESESKVVDALNKYNETVTEKNEQILALENRMKEVADQNSVAYDGHIQAAKIEHQQQMDKIEMLTKQLTLMEEAHKETKVKAAELLKKFEDASNKLTSTSKELIALVDEKQKGIDCLQQQFEEASEKLSLKSEEHKTLVGDKQKEIDCLQQQLEESESKVVDALNKHNETVTKKNEQILALENRIKEVAVQNSVVNDGEMQAAKIEHR